MKTEAEKQLAKLVSMPTISDDITANDMALDYIEGYITERGMHCQRHRYDGHGSLTASTRLTNAKTPTVLLAAHVDVMGGSEQMFTLRTVGDKLIGRGVYDMKFAIAGYLQLVNELKGRLHDYDFGIMITTDEEYGGRDNINSTPHLLKAGYRPKVCVVPDSTAPGWNIEKIAKGAWRFDLIAKGRTAHGSRPWEGESASFKLIHALHELKAMFANHGPATDTLNIGVIHGGETYNQIPSLMTASLEIRLVDETSYDRNVALIQALCKKHDIGYKDRIATLPLNTDLSDPVVYSFMQSIEAVTGNIPDGVISYGLSDAKYFSKAAVPCILSCPEGGGHHSENEWISRKSFLQFVPILKDYLGKTARIRDPAASKHLPAQEVALL